MTPTKERRYTITNRQRETGRVPELRMSGRWLGLAGFAAGCRLAVAVECGRLVVTVVAQPPPRRRRRVPEDEEMPWYARR